MPEIDTDGFDLPFHPLKIEIINPPQIQPR